MEILARFSNVAVLGVPILAAYVYFYRYWYWQVPRRKWRHLSGLLICLTGGTLLGLGVQGLEGLWALFASWPITSVGAFVGAVVFFYVAVKVGSPAHVGIVVTCDSISTLTSQGEEGQWEPSDSREQTLRDRLGNYGLHRPTGQQAAWPEFFYVAQEGSLTWYLCGEPGTEVIVRFGLANPRKKYFDPFTEDPANPSMRSEFRGIVPSPPPGFAGRVPGIIVAGPVVNPGRGDYEIEIIEPGRPSVILDPSGGDGKKGG